MSAARSDGAGVREGLHALPALHLPGMPAAFAASAGGGGVALLGFARGGYYATTWGWAAIVALVVGALAVAHSRRVQASGGELVLLGGLVVLVLWTIAETVRRGAATRGVPVAERTVLYLVVVWAAVQLLRRRTLEAALVGLLAGIVVLSSSGLVTLLVPQVVRADAFEGRLLFLPLGYANACGILAALGVLLALGFSGHPVTALRAAAAASLVPLVVALDLTGSRGAELAVVAGLAAAVALDATRRTALLAVLYLPVPLAAALAASRTHVTDVQATTALVARDGRLVLVAIVALTAGQAAFALRVHRVTENAKARRYASRALLACVTLGGAAAVARMGLGGALGDRPAYWHAAFADVRAHPLLGSGPGSFATEWLQRRTTPLAALNAHNLYLETLAELGPLGLAALLTALAAPLAHLRRRMQATTAAAAGAYVAFLLHAGLDWDWQMPAVTIAGLLCGVCLLVADRGDHEGSARRRRWIVDCALVCTAALVVAAGAAAVGNRALAAAVHAEQTGATETQARLARVAAVWQPWSAEPRRLLGDAELAEGADGAARRSYEQAVALDPANVAAWVGLVRVGGADGRLSAVRNLARLDPLLIRSP